MRIRYMILAMMIGVLWVGIANATSCTSSGLSFKVLNVAWGNSTYQVSAGPGEMDIPLTVTLESYSTVPGVTVCNAIDLEGDLQLFGGLSGFNGADYSTYYIQSISPSSIFQMVFYLNIGNVSAGPGSVYSYPLYLSYNYPNSTTINTQSINLQIPVYGSSDFEYTPQEYGLLPGLNNLTMKVTNTGSGELSDLRTTVSAPSGMSILSQPSAINSLMPGDSANVTFQAYIQSGDSAPLTLSVNTAYVNAYGYNNTKHNQVGFYTLTSQENLFIYPENNTLVTGILENESIVLSNTGNTPIYNVSVSLSSGSQIDIIGKNYYDIIPEVPAESTVTFPVTVYVDPSSGAVVRSLTASLTYSLNNQEMTLSRDISFLTPGYINLTEISTTMLPSEPSRGDIFTLTSTLDNLGSQPAQTASVTAFPPEGITILGQNTTFIGSIPVGTPTAFTLSFIAAPSVKAGIYRIPVVVSYLNSLNERIDSNLTFDVDMGAGNFTGSSGGKVVTASAHGPEQKGGFPILLFVVIIALAAGAYYVYSRKKRREKR